MVMAPRMPLQPGAMNMPKSGVNISRSWSGLSGWPSAMANARATCAEARCSGRSIKHVEDMRNGIDEPEKNQGKQRCPEEPRTAEEQNDSGAIGEDDQRSAAEHRSDHCGEKTKMRIDWSRIWTTIAVDDQDGQPPPAAVHLPAERTPRPQDQHKADQRNEHADRLQRIGGPHATTERASWTR